MRPFLVVLVILLCRPAIPQGMPPAPVSQQQTLLEAGKILPRISCSAHPDQTYALYLPSNYSPSRRWPLVISSDPGARGSVPLELQKDAAERFGYVLASSNNSRNGPWQPRLEATQAALADIQGRVAIDSHRVYFAGFSGGVRFSSQVASSCKCSVGVLLSGAGFFTPTVPSTDPRFPVFSAVGTADFNYSEVIPLQDALANAGYPHWLRVFEGSHQWAPAEVMEEAFSWFRIQAMKTKREPLDASFVQEQFRKVQDRANSFETAGDPLALWREYVQIAATYDSLVDVSSIPAKAEALPKDKAAHDALKREQNDFYEQARLTSEIISRLAAPQRDEDNPLLEDRESQQQLLRLRQNAEHEKRPDRARVFKRALGGVFVSTMESGNSLLEAKNFPAAIRAYDFATQALPESPWAWSQLATAQALAGRKKDALTSLRRAHELSLDKSAFANWLQTEPAFTALRSSPEFQILIP
jgi:predicted esterase